MPRQDHAQHRRPRLQSRPSLESLEARSLLSLNGLFAVPVAASGSGSVDIESNAVTNDASGDVFITGSLVGTANFAPSGTAVNLTSQAHGISSSPNTRRQAHSSGPKTSQARGQRASLRVRPSPSIALET